MITTIEREDCNSIVATISTCVFYSLYVETKNKCFVQIYDYESYINKKQPLMSSPIGRLVNGISRLEKWVEMGLYLPSLVVALSNEPYMLEPADNCEKMIIKIKKK